MNLKSIVEKGWNFTQDYISRAVSSPIDTVKTITLTAIATMIIGCPGKTPTEPDNPPYFTSSTPTAQTTTTNIGNTHTVRGTAEDPDGDSINYKTLKDGTQVNNTNEYTFTIDKKGMTKIQIVAYNALSDTLTKNFSANNQRPIATSKSITSYEETTTYTPESELGYDPDGDNLEYTVTNTSTGVDAKFENGNLVIEREKDYFGNASVNYSLTDGEATANGKVNDEIVNTQDDPKANAGEDKAKTIDEEITLDGTASNHPDNPINTITEYLWRQISGPNTNITNADQENANFTANTRGNYQIELTVTDEQGATGKDTMNVIINSYKIIGNISELFNEGVAIAGTNVAFGDKSTTTNASGYYNLELKIGTNDARLVITHPSFYERQTSSFTAKDTTLNETMVEESFNIEHYDKITRYAGQVANPGTQRWVTPPTIYIDTSPAPNPDGSTTAVTQDKIDMALEVIADLPQFAKGLYPNNQVNIEIGTNPPEFNTENYIVFSWDNTIPGRGEHGEGVDKNKIFAAETKVKTTSGKGTMRQEITQNHGARNDSDIVEGIFNDPLGTITDYSNNDLKIGTFLYTRTLGNLSPDKDP